MKRDLVAEFREFLKDFESDLTDTDNQISENSTNWAKMNNKESQDNVNHPSHYENSCSLECIDVMEAMFGPDNLIIFCFMNAFKYLWRFKNKNGKEDLDKAWWYLRKGTSTNVRYVADNEKYDHDFREWCETMEKRLCNLYGKIENKEKTENENSLY